MAESIKSVKGYAIGGGQVFQQLCDISIASEKAIFGQVGPRFGSFDMGMGAGSLARLVGEKKAREIWFQCRRYSAQEALEMGLVNAVVPHEKLEEETVKRAKEMLELSPTALKFLKYSFNSQTTPPECQVTSQEEECISHSYSDIQGLSVFEMIGEEVEFHGFLLHGIPLGIMIVLLEGGDPPFILLPLVKVNDLWVPPAECMQ